MTNFFTADTHFGHARIIELCERPFKHVDEMNKTIIRNFNERAGEVDTIYLLGDACLGKLDESLSLVADIKAKVVLIPGNHDRMSLAYHHKGDATEKRRLAVERYSSVFSEVRMEAPGAYSSFLSPFAEEGLPIIMSHYPYVGDSHGEERYAHLRPINIGMPLLHGHVHTQWKHRDRMWNVGVDVNDFQLVSEDEVREWFDTLGVMKHEAVGRRRTPPT